MENLVQRQFRIEHITQTTFNHTTVDANIDATATPTATVDQMIIGFNIFV